MIPTLFGVTIVSFVIMQLAPGDPLLMQADAGGNASRSAQTREAFLLQKRDLQLDKPLVLNFNDFRDFTAPIKAAAHFLGMTPKQVAAELSRPGGTAIRSWPQHAWRFSSRCRSRILASGSMALRSATH